MSNKKGEQDVHGVNWLDQFHNYWEEKTKIQNQLVEKQIKYEVANCMQMAMGMAMIQALNNLTQVMTQAFMQVAINNDTQTSNATTTKKEITNNEEVAND